MFPVFKYQIRVADTVPRTPVGLNRIGDTIHTKPINSPWGTPHGYTQTAPGVWWTDTPSHGGFMVDRAHAAQLVANQAICDSTPN